MKRRSIAFILMMSLLPVNFAFAADDEKLNVNIGKFNSDLFLKTSEKASVSYKDDLYYYDGDKFESTITFGDMTYNLDGDMGTKGNDVIKIDTSDVSISFDSTAVKKLGLVLFTREEQADNEITVTINYENDKTEDHKIKVPAMTDAADDCEGTNPLKVVKSGAWYWPKVDDTELVYLTDVVIDNSTSVNKNLSAESVTLKAADFDYYLAAATVIKFSESELDEQTQQTVRELYTKYEEVNLIQLGSGNNELTLDEANELYASLLKQEGKMEEATAENIEKIKILIDGASLYAQIKGYKTSLEILIGDYPEKSADFTELSQTDLTDEDYENLAEILEIYANVKEFDDTELLEIAEEQGVLEELDIDINTDDEEKIQALYDAYTKAAKRAELREKIAPVYNEYIDKSIDEITSSDRSQLEKLMGYFEEAEESSIVFEEYNSSYIAHLYNDYEAYKTSQDYTPIDISYAYNVDTIGKAGDMANASTWYEFADNLSGDKFTKSYHSGISSYDSANSILYLKEYAFEKTETTDPTTLITTTSYAFNETGKTMPFKMPAEIFNTNICDGILIKNNDTGSYTFSMSGKYTDKIYFAIAKVDSNQANISPVITYTDGSKETVSALTCSTGQTVNEYRSKRNTYPDMSGQIVSGDYKNINRATTGVLYKPDNNVTNGMSVFTVSINPEKSPSSITFGAAAGDYVLYGAGEIPVANSIIVERVNTLYSHIVTDGKIDTSDLTIVSELVLNYNDAKNRGLYLEDVDEAIMKELSKMVLTASGSIYREAIDLVRADIKFTVPVNEQTLSGAINVTYDGNSITDFTYDLDDDDMTLTIDIPVTRNGGKEMTVKVSNAVTIKEYSSIGMVNEAIISFVLPYHISAVYTENSNLTVLNNSNTDQRYLAYVTVIDGGKVTNSQTVTGTVAANSHKEIAISVMPYVTDTAVVYAAVLEDETLKPLYEITEPAVTVNKTDLTADYKNPSLNVETNVLTASGLTTSKAKDKIMTIIVNSPVGGCLYAGEVKTNEDGYFRVDIPLNEENIPLSGYLNIKISGEDFEEAVEINDVYFSVMGDRTGFVNNLKTAENVNDVKSLLISAQQKLSLNFTPFVKCVDSYLDNLAERVFNIRTSIPEILDTDSDQEKNEKVSKAQKLIKQQSILECIANNEAELVSADGQLLHEDIMDYAKIDSDGITLYSLYKNNTSATGKNAVVDGIMGKEYTSLSALYDDIEELSMLYALKNPASNGTGHVQKVLTKENADSVGITITKYLNLSSKSQANSHIANMTIGDLSDVVNYIKTLGSDTVNQSGSSSGGGGGGGSSASAASVAVVTNTETIPSLADEKSPFGDLGVSHWAYEAVKSLYEKNIVNGNDTGKFLPEESITRAEFVKLLCTATGLEPTVDSGRFTDVADSQWFAPYVGAVSAAGIVNGISETEFGANEPISRQDICTILYRAEKAETEAVPEFTDKDVIADYAKPAVAYLNEKGIINGFTDGTFKPSMSCTRAQAAMIIYNYLNERS